MNRNRPFKEEERGRGTALSVFEIAKWPVVDLDGKSLGTMQDIRIDPESGGVAYMVLSIDRWRLVAVPYEAVRILSERRKVRLMMYRSTFDAGRNGERYETNDQPQSGL